MTNDTSGTPATPLEAPASTPTPKLLKVPGGSPDLDKQLRDLVDPDTGLIKLRLAAAIYHPVDRNYANYDTVSWIGEFPHAEAASAFREDLDAWIRGWFAART